MDYVSCHSASDYQDFDLAADAASNLKPGMLTLEAKAVIFPASAYTREYPVGIYTSDSDFRSQLLALYENINRPGRTGPSALLVELEEAAVLNNVVYSSTGGQTSILYETHRPNDRPYVHLAGPDVIQNESIRTPAEGRCFFYLGSVGSFNYGHWLVDDLPRLLSVRQIRILRPECHIVVTVPSYNSVLDKAKAAAIDAALVEFSNYSIYFIRPGLAHSFEHLYFL